MTGEALGRLCSGGGWTYAALWLIDCRDPRLFVLKESYTEEQTVKAFAKLINHVHVIGQGTIGEVVISGKHRWINFEESSSVIPDFLKNNEEWQVQIFAGIKTIAVIPLPSFGVIQFGSTQKICESSDFIAQAQNLLHQLQIKQQGYVHPDLDFFQPQGTFASTVSSLDSSRYKNKNNIFSLDSFYEQRLDSCLSSERSMPEPTSSAYRDHGNLFCVTPCFTGSSSYGGINQEEALKKARNSSPSINSEMHPKLKFPSNLCAISSKNHIRAKEINLFSYMDHQPFTSMPLPGVFNTNPITSHSSIPRMDTCHLVTEKFVSSHSKGGSKATLDNGNVSSKFSPLTPDFSENFITSPQNRNNEISTSINESTNHHIFDKSMNKQIHFVDRSSDCFKSTSDIHNQLVTDHNDLFVDIELDPSPMILRQECWDELELPAVSTSCTNLNIGVSDCISEFAMDSIAVSCKEFFTDSSSIEQLLDAVVSRDANLSTSCSSFPRPSSRHHISTITELNKAHISGVPFDVPSLLVHTSTEYLPEINIEKMIQGSPKKEQTLGICDSCSVNAECSALHLLNKQEEYGKSLRKRARPGESTRPKPKDRQQIQDRVKELREIVPNSAKCSIDALLDRTIKHMLFLQSVTNYADKVIKQVDEPELVGEESGVVLKDNTNGGVGGATWAYEVAGQTMVCPILVEDVHPSGQMVVEMLCEERGFFLEIADVVRGFGLTILKGVMELRERKLWSKFLVEANREVTRMDIFLSLVQLLHQASSFRSAESHSSSIVEGGTSHRQQCPAPISTGFDDRLL